MIKKIFLTFLLLTSVWAFAQVPQGINYQGVARDNSGNALANTNISVQFTILQSGTSVFSETKSLTTDTFGLYTHVIGSISTGQFNAINWAGGNLSIQIGIDPTGGSSYTTVATSVLQSVPYALYAASSGNVAATQSLSISSNTLSISGGNSVTLPASTDAQTLTINSNTLSIQNGNSVVLPTAATQTLALTSNTLSISGGNSVVLPTNTSTVASGSPVLGDGTAANPITMAPANTSTNGYLTSGDWNTFNNKVSSISNGTGIISSNISGSYTVSADNNNPIWNAGQLQGQPVSITTPTLGQVLTYTAGNWIPSTLPSSALPTPQVGSILYSNSSNTWTATNPSGIYTDGTNIGIGNSTPGYKLDINTSANAIGVTSSYTGTVVNFNGTAAGGGSPVLQVTSNSSNGYAIKADNLNGAAIVANSQGPYGVNGNITGGSGNAMEGDILNGAHGNAVAGYIDSTSLGSAGYFTNFNDANSFPTLYDSTHSPNAYSARFIGGKGLQTDQIQITGTSSAPPLAGYVLTSDALGNATWQFAASGSNWSTAGNNAGAADYIGTNNSQPFIFKTNNAEAMRIDGNSQSLGIGTGATSLVSQLDVNGNIHTNTGKILFGNVGGVDDGYTGIYGGSGSGDLVLAVFKPSSSGSIGSANSYDALTVKGNTGNVGIGTTTPSALLDVQAGSNVAVNILNTGDIPALVVNASAGSGNSSATFAGGTGVATDNLTNGNMITTNSLTVNGGFHLSLNANLGQVLTSDATGNGSWQPIPSSAVTVSAPLTGNGLSGTPIMLPTVTTATTVGSATQIPTFSVDVYGRVSNASNIAITGLLPTGTNGQTLVNNGTSWAATSNLFNNGTGIGINNTTPAAMLDVVAATNSVAINAVNTGTAGAISASASGTGGAIYGTTSGSGIAIEGFVTGTAAAGDFVISNPSNTNAAVYASTNGSGNVLQISTTGSGEAASFNINNVSNGSSGINVVTNGTGSSGSFSGGTGLKTDKITISTGAASGLVLTSTNASGNATWQAPAVLGASNGLSVSTGSVQLGGTLLNNTTITQAANNIIFNGSTGNFQINNTGANPAVNVNTTGSGQGINVNSNAGNGVNISSGNGTGVNASINPTGASTSAAIAGFNNGIGGYGANIQTSSNANTYPTIYVSNAGTGTGMAITNTYTSNGAAVIDAATNGIGKVGNFTINNINNSSSAINATTNGQGSALNLTNTGIGSLINATTNSSTVTAVSISSTYSANTQPALWLTYSGTGTGMTIINNNTSQTGYGLDVLNTSSNPGIYAQNDGTGASILAFKGSASGIAGNFQINNISNGSTALNVGTTGTGYSAKFNGGLGLQTDKFQMLNGATSGAVLTSDGSGNASWVSPNLPVNFSANAVNTQGISTGSTTQIINFPNVLYLNGGSLVSGVYTAPVSGIYHIDAAVSLSNNFSSPIYIRLYVNGAEVKEVQYGSAAQSPIGFAISGDVSVISGQTIDIRIFSTSTAESTAAVAAGTTVWFNGHLVR